MGSLKDKIKLNFFEWWVRVKLITKGIENIIILNQKRFEKLLFSGELRRPFQIIVDVIKKQTPLRFFLKAQRD